MTEGEGISTLSCVCVCVNMMIGAGFLALPQGFLHGGIVSSICLLGVVGYWLKISCVWEGRCVVQASRVINKDAPDGTRHKVPEVPEAFNLFCGSKWRNAYAAVLFVSFLSCAWVLAILFGQTMSSSMPFIYHGEVVCTEHDGGEASPAACNTRYLINMVILAALTTPLALLDVKEQWYVQNTLAVVRVCRVLLMCITPMMVGEIGDSAAMRRSFPVSFAASSAPSVGPSLFVGSMFGLSQLLSAAVFSQFLNGSIPIIIDSLKDRNNYIRVINLTFGVCFVLYVWLSIVVSTQFGSATADPCNLNWVGYRWPSTGTDPSACAMGSFCDISAKLVEFVIVFCPAVDVVSAYPFLPIILGNSLTEMVLGADSEETNATPSSTGEIVSSGSQRWLSYKSWNKIFRFAMNILPMIMAVTIKNFSTVIQLTGAISVLICLVFPPLLSSKCNSFLEENFKNFSHCVIPYSAHLSWIDEPRPNADSFKQSNMKNYGALPQAEVIDGCTNPRHQSAVVPFKSDELIENDVFKSVFLSVGIVITGVILYISTH